VLRAPAGGLTRLERATDDPPTVTQLNPELRAHVTCGSAVLEDFRRDDTEFIATRGRMPDYFLGLSGMPPSWTASCTSSRASDEPVAPYLRSPPRWLRRVGRFQSRHFGELVP
jgi:hypothetical protein